MTRIYLDYAASTPVDPRVLRAMRPYFSEKFGNPGSLHSFGQEAIAAVDSSRETIARAIGADFREIIFTGSATEANNTALRGVVGRIMKHEARIKQPMIIVSAIEHESVLETARDLERDGVEVIYLPVDRGGIVDLKKFEASLNDRTVLVSVMYANNEIGTVQPIAEIAKIIRSFRDAKNANTCELCEKNVKEHSRHSHGFVISHRLPLLHTDAVQAFQFLDCDVNKLGIDLMTLSAHKIYGPKGIGLLYRRIPNSQFLISKQTPNSKSEILNPIITGGGQEWNLRSGTENVPLTVGFAKAIELLMESKKEESRRIPNLKEYFLEKLKIISPDAEVNGVPEAKSKKQKADILHDSGFMLPNILNVYFPHHKAEELLTKFDIAGLAASSGSACRSRAMESSYVIEALGFTKDRAKRSIRFSFGGLTTKEELDKALEIIKVSIK